MAYDVKNIKRFAIGATLGTGSTATAGLWHYKTNDAAATVETANYFNSLVGEMNVGDVIWASLAQATAPIGKTYTVTANSGTVVTIAVFS